MNQKSIIAILGVVVVILIGSTVYFATINKSSQPVAPTPKVVQWPTPTNETANWQTYSNEKYSFELKYPANYSMAIGNTAPGFVVGFMSVERKKEIENEKLFPSGNDNLDIYFSDNINKAKIGTSPGEPVYKSLADYLDPKNSKFVAVQKVGEIKIGELKAYEVILPGIQGNYGIMFEKNGVYTLSFGGTPNKATLSDSDKKIISTLKFTK